MRRSEFAQTISHAPFRHVGSDPFALSWRALWNRQFKSLKTSLRRPDSCTIVHFYVTATEDLTWDQVYIYDGESNDGKGDIIAGCIV